jgi:plastocyanin
MATTLRSRSMLLVGAVLLVGLLLVFADTFGGTGATSSGTDVTLVMEDYAFEPSAVTVPAGVPVRFTFDNRDEVSHAVSFGRTVVQEGERVVAFEEDLFDGLTVSVTPATAQVEPEPPYDGFTALVQGGHEVTIEVTIPEARQGEWQIGCFTGLGCHYQAGLAAGLTVD